MSAIEFQGPAADSWRASLILQREGFMDRPPEVTPGYPDVRISTVDGRGHRYEVFCHTCGDIVGLLDTEEEALRERGAHLDEAHNTGRAR